MQRIRSVNERVSVINYFLSCFDSLCWIIEFWIFYYSEFWRWKLWKLEETHACIKKIRTIIFLDGFHSLGLGLGLQVQTCSHLSLYIIRGRQVVSKVIKWIRVFPVLQHLFDRHPLSPAQPGGLEPAPHGQHDGAQHGWSHVLRASQGDGFGSKLPRLHFFPQARPGPPGLPRFPGNSASYQPEGESSSSNNYFHYLFITQEPPRRQPTMCLLLGRRDV